jgi:XTP/dITP diphosphohydrolase
MRLTSGDRLVLATHNAGKLAEFVALLGPFGLEVISAAALGLPEPPETENTFLGNARIKGHAAAQATGLPCLADDSGLCVDALDGSPGVHSADWAEGPEGRDFHRAMKRVRGSLEGHPEPWTAQFRSTLVLCWPGGTDRVFEGVLPGRIVWPMRGLDGHGYDPIFQADGMDRTVAELTPDEKNAVSHRARALRALIAACFT